MTQRRDLKRYARGALSGKYSSVILALIIVEALSFFSGSIAGELFPGSTTVDMVLGNVFTFIVTLLVNVVTAGMGYMYLNIARGKEYSMSDLFYFYKHHPDRVITAAFVLALISVITMLPANLYNYSYDFSTVMNSAAAYITAAEVEALAEYAVHFLLLMIVGLLVCQIVTIPLEMTYFLLADHPQMKGMEAVKESIKMMKGSFWRMLLLKLSFLPLLVLSGFTFYIALLWVLPYINMTSVMFYRDLRGELGAEPDETAKAAEVYSSFEKREQSPEHGTGWIPKEVADADRKADTQEPLHLAKADTQEPQHLESANMQDMCHDGEKDSEGTGYSEEKNLTEEADRPEKEKAAVHLEKPVHMIKEAENTQESENTVKEITVEKDFESKESVKKQETEEEEDNVPKPWDEYFNGIK